MAEPPARKVIALVKLNAVELKLTLTPKVLAKPFVDGVIRPFLVAFNKKAKGDASFSRNTPPLAAKTSSASSSTARSSRTRV